MKKAITDEMGLEAYNTLRKYCHTTKCGKCIFGDIKRLRCALTNDKELVSFYDFTKINTQKVVRENKKLRKKCQNLKIF